MSFETLHVRDQDSVYARYGADSGSQIGRLSEIAFLSKESRLSEVAFLSKESRRAEADFEVAVTRRRHVTVVAKVCKLT